MTMRFDLRPTALPNCVGDPYYCALSFGQEPERLVWLAIDDEYIYVDRQAKGDLAEVGNRVRFPVKRYGVPIDAGALCPAGTREPVRLKLHQFLIGGRRTIYLHFWFADGRREGASPVWSTSPASAPVLPLFGPLTFVLADPAVTFVSGGDATKLEVMLGRTGDSAESFVWRSHSEVPHTVQPLAEIRFPGQSIPQTFHLEGRCCGCRFHCFLEPPNNLHGLAEVRVSFSDWPA
ncbi:MAG TPA: hypothetical protein VFI31_11690, partial [Pirellulales bacterium]|nr:hypothetical protein [Pirellulales bacterium]